MVAGVHLKKPLEFKHTPCIDPFPCKRHGCKYISGFFLSCGFIHIS